jgi:hypothetical protein
MKSRRRKSDAVSEHVSRREQIKENMGRMSDGAVDPDFDALDERELHDFERPAVSD